jgi:hypothetical protein
MSYWTRVLCNDCKVVLMHCVCKREDSVKKLDMTDYVPTQIDSPKLGWDDPNEKEYTCANCNGLVGVVGRIYGLVATWCMCGKPTRPEDKK